MMASVPRLELNNARRKSLEQAAASVEQAREAYENAKTRRNSLIADTLEDIGDQHGALAAIARASGVKLETVRLIRKGAWR